MGANVEGPYVYLRYTQAELDRAYTQSAWAPNMHSLIGGWQEAGTDCRTNAFGFGTHAYGPTPDEQIDVFELPGRIVHFHIHGGAWQRQQKEDCSFLARAMRSLGAPLAVPEFGKLPDTRMPVVLEQIAQALLWTHERFIEKGDAEGIVVSGHSSGAHMAALIAAHDFAGLLPVSSIRAVLCLSGSYDLHPVLLSVRNTYIDLNPEEVSWLSPIKRVADMRVPLHLAYGQNESPEFIRQSKAFAAALSAAGKLASCTEIEAANHFEVADQLGALDAPVGRLLAGLLAMPHSPADLGPPPTLEAGPLRTPETPANL
jgi:arylformamidase